MRREKKLFHMCASPKSHPLSSSLHSILLYSLVCYCLVLLVAQNLFRFSAFIPFSHIDCDFWYGGCICRSRTAMCVWDQKRWKHFLLPLISYSLIVVFEAKWIQLTFSFFFACKWKQSIITRQKRKQRIHRNFSRFEWPLKGSKAGNYCCCLMAGISWIAMTFAIVLFFLMELQVLLEKP